MCEESNKWNMRSVCSVTGSCVDINIKKTMQVKCIHGEDGSGEQ